MKIKINTQIKLNNTSQIPHSENPKIPEIQQIPNSKPVSGKFKFDIETVSTLITHHAAQIQRRDQKKILRMSASKSSVFRPQSTKKSILTAHKYARANPCMRVYVYAEREKEGFSFEEEEEEQVGLSRSSSLSSF